MSKERLNNVSLGSDLLDLESSLKGLSAAGNVNRDELLFQAGFRSANHRSASLNRFWKCVSTVLAVMLVGQSFFFWTDDDGKIADDNSPRGSEVAPDHQTPTYASDSQTPGPVMNTLHANQKTLPTRRSELLQLRRVALAQGLDAAFSADTDEAAVPADTRSKRQELLCELLGS